MFSSQRLLALILYSLIVAIAFFSYNKGKEYLSAQKQQAIEETHKLLTFSNQQQTQKVSNWLDANSQKLTELAENISLKLYLTEIQQQDTTNENSYQTTYLSRLIAKQGDSTFLTDKNGQIITSNSSPTNIAPLLQQYITDGSKISDIYQNSKGSSNIAFFETVNAVQSNTVVGYLVTLKDASSLLRLIENTNPAYQHTSSNVASYSKDSEFLKFLVQNDANTSTTSTYKKNHTNDTYVEFLALENEKNIVEGEDFSLHENFAIASKVGQSNWFVISKALKQSALHNYYNYANILIAAIIIANIAVIFLLRSIILSDKLKRSKAREDITKIIADNEPDPAFIINSSYVCSYVNAKAALKFGKASNECVGLTLDELIGQNHYNSYKSFIEDTLEKNHINHSMTTSDQTMATSEQNGNCAIIQLKFVPITNPHNYEKSVLVLEHKISPITEEHGQKESSPSSLTEVHNPNNA